MKKDFFKIGEITKLFGIGPDSIRYYEKKGLLHPKRMEENNYRSYNLEDIREILMIRELLSLGFSVNDCKEFQQDKTLDRTLRMFIMELEMVQEKMDELEKMRQSIETKLRRIQNAGELKKRTEIHLLELKERPCMMISSKNIPDNRVSLHAAKYCHKNKTELNTIGACDCYTLDLENSNPESPYYRTHNVFLYYSDSADEKCDWSLPAGLYLSRVYEGSPVQTKLLMPSLFEYAKEHGLEPCGMPIEFCYIDGFETGCEDEYVIEIQLPVKRTGEKK